jgi:hypothetical protein
VRQVGEAVRLDDIVAGTPATRDRVVDFLRAASIVAVVFGHWMIGIVWQDGVVRTTSAVGVTTGLWLATWFFQVMPIFFFVGGFSNLVSLEASRRRGDPDGRFVKTRVVRLLRPSLVFFAIWSAVIIGMHLLDVGAPTGPRIWDGTTLLRSFLPPGATLPFGPLWFLAVYLVVVCIAPWMVDLHRRFRWWVPAVMVAGACVADVIGFAVGISPVRWANVAFVLLLPHQLGFFYADGTFARLPKRFFWVMVAVGLGGLLALTNPPILEAVRRRPVRLVPRDRRLPEEPARHRRRAGLERVSANRLLPARCDLVDRRSHAAPTVARAMAPADRSLEGHDRSEQRDHDVVPVAHDRVPLRGVDALAARGRPSARQHGRLVAGAAHLDRALRPLSRGARRRVRPVRATETTRTGRRRRLIIAIASQPFCNPHDAGPRCYLRASWMSPKEGTAAQ